MKIGSMELNQPLALAPMEDVSDRPFRLICKEKGADLLFTEFTHCEAIIREVDSAINKIRVTEAERPIGIQLYGSLEASLEKATRTAEELGPDFIDINCGCWVKKVALRGDGAGLLRDLKKFESVVRTVVRSTRLPVTVKTRLGWDAQNIVILDVVRMLEQNGVAALTLHCRTRDHLGCYGYPRDTSPFMDRLAQEGIVFEDALVLAPWTVPSVASLFASQHPRCLLSEEFTFDLSDAESVFAEHLKSEGFRTGAFLTNTTLGREFSFDRGFDHFVETKIYKLRKKGKLLHEQLFPWVTQEPGTPTFAYAHYMEVHGPYRAPDEYARLFFPPDYPLPPIPVRGGVTPYQNRLFIEQLPIEISPEKKEEIITLYDACIRQMDDLIKEFFTFLEEHSLRDRSIVWIISDHGEELFDHCSVKHSYTLHEEILRIPMLLFYPDCPRGLRVKGQVDLRDLLPTTVELLGGNPGELSVEGESLLPLIRGEQSGKNVVISECVVSHKTDRWIVSIRSSKDKWLIDRLGGEERYYDLVDDPSEQHPLSSPPPEIEAKYQPLFEAWRDRCGDGFPNPEYSQEFLERLQDLGYLSTTHVKPPSIPSAFTDCEP